MSVYLLRGDDVAAVRLRHVAALGLARPLTCHAMEEDYCKPDDNEGADRCRPRPVWASVAVPAVDKVSHLRSPFETAGAVIVISNFPHQSVL